MSANPAGVSVESETADKEQHWAASMLLSPVLAGPWLLGTSVILPPGHPLVLPHIAESFRWFGQVHAAWLNDLGINAKCVSSAQAHIDESLAWAESGLRRSRESSALPRSTI